MPSPGTHSYDEVLRTQCGPFEISNAFGMSQVPVAAPKRPIAGRSGNVPAWTFAAPSRKPAGEPKQAERCPQRERQSSSPPCLCRLPRGASRLRLLDHGCTLLEHRVPRATARACRFDLMPLRKRSDLVPLRKRSPSSNGGAANFVCNNCLAPLIPSSAKQGICATVRSDD
jgi:hypothetical protein